MPAALDHVHHNFSRLTPAYLTLHISGGQVGLPIIIGTLLLSKKVARHPTLLNFFHTWVIYSVVYCILLYSGQRHQPQAALCQVQSALIHGVSPMCATSTLALVIQLWRTLREPPVQQTVTLSGSRWPTTLRLRVMLAMPYIVFSVFVTLTALLQRQQGVVITGNGLYCALRGETFVRYAVPAFCTTMLVIIVGFEVAIAIRYFQMQRTISDSFPLADTGKKSPVMALRVLAFSLYTLVTLSVGVLSLSGKGMTPWPYMIQAALPLSAFLVFGTQKDIFLVWLFWKPYPTVPAFDISTKHSPHQHTRPVSGAPSEVSTIFSIERIPTLPVSNV